MFCGIIVIHRVITYIPTYSGFKYEDLALTNVILAFLVIVLSIQSKLGIKVNILVDRLSDLWNGKAPEKPKQRQGMQSMHVPSQADDLDTQHNQQDIFPPAPISAKPNMRSAVSSVQDDSDYGYMSGPMAANGVLGSGFGSLF